MVYGVVVYPGHGIVRRVASAFFLETVFFLARQIAPVL